MKSNPLLTTILLSLWFVSTIMIAHAMTPLPQEMTEGQEYVVQADDWLSKIAEKFYGDILAYPTIVEATNTKAAEDDSFTMIDNPDVIEVGQKLWIPDLEMDSGLVADEAMMVDSTEPEMTEEPEQTEMAGETATVDSSTTISPTSYALSGEAVFPEGVAYNPNTGKFYVGSTGDGTLYEGDVTTGEVTAFSEGGADGRITAVGMKVDADDNLWVSGGATGQIFVYSTIDGSLVTTYTTPAADQTFINDVIFTSDGSAYFTDSFRPMLFKVNGTAGGEAPAWLDFTDTVVEYGEGFNLNGIAATADGRYLIVVHSTLGQLYRIDTETQAVTLIDTAGAELTAGDGILLVDETLYVTRNRFGEIVPVSMTADYSVGTVDSAITHESFVFPTTIAKVDDTLLVVNSQFNNRNGTPVLPFTVSRIALP